MNQSAARPQPGIITPEPTSPATSARVERDRQILVDAQSRGGLATFAAFIRLSGPGWLQSAITLGGGSLSGALYLGVLGGYSFLWLQVLAIILGIIMLGAISYVTLATGLRPFQAIRRHINPVLAWGWAVASLIASLVWCLPQFSLSVAVVQQNLLPGLLGADSALGATGGKVLICALLLAISATIVWRYARPGRGIRVFEGILKTMVALIVFSFVGVVIKMAVSGTGLPWGQIFSGYIPDLDSFTRPAATFLPFLNEIAPDQREFWSRAIVSRQQDVMIAAAAAAVGINMTFFLPYSILARGWTREFRGLAIFDLATGLAIPFVLVISCIVIASASQFHTQPGTGLLNDGKPTAGIQRDYNSLLESRLKNAAGNPAPAAPLSPEDKTAQINALPQAEKQMAAMLVSRDAFQLADSLAPLTGRAVSQLLFGAGVLGMALSTIIMMMVISGVVLREMFDWPPGGIKQRLGSMVAGVGVLGPFIWSGKALFWLAVPASVVAMTLLPIAYFTFFLMMNSRKLLGDNMPRGGARVTWNVLMIFATLGATIAAAWSIWAKGGWIGTAAALLFITAAVVAQFLKKPNHTNPEESLNA